MRNRILPLSVAIFLATTMPNYGQNAKMTDTDKLQGKWQVSEFVVAGKNIGVAGRPMTFAGNIMTLELGWVGNEPKTYTFKLDEKTKPKSIELTELGGPLEAEASPGIYRFNGVDLVLCLQNDPSNPLPPQDFDSKEGSRNLLIKLKRAK